MTLGRRQLLRVAASAVAAPAVLRIGRARAAETLRLHHMSPQVSNIHTHVLAPWAEKVEAATDRALRIRIYPSMQLGGTPVQLYDQARDGVVDIIWTLPGYTAGRFPSLDVFELPFVAARSGITNSKAVQEYAATQAQEDLREVHLLFSWANDHGVVHADRQIHKMEDLHGAKMRFPTRYTGEALTLLGAAAIGMPAPQVPESLAQGVINGAILPWEVVPSLKVHELVEHHTEFPGSPSFYTSTHIVAINKARYEALPAELRQVLDDASGLAAAEAAGQAVVKAGDEARALAEKRGNEIHVLSEEEAARWRQTTQPVIDAWLKATLNGERLLEQARTLLARHEQA
jgi:TRAP-type C4-dicarboxylate transport system substrate-binding protein